MAPGEQRSAGIRARSVGVCGRPLSGAGFGCALSGLRRVESNSCQWWARVGYGLKRRSRKTLLGLVGVSQPEVPRAPRCGARWQSVPGNVRSQGPLGAAPAQPGSPPFRVAAGGMGIVRPSWPCPRPCWCERGEARPPLVGSSIIIQLAEPATRSRLAFWRHVYDNICIRLSLALVEAVLKKLARGK